MLCLFIAKYRVFLKLPQTYITIENPFDRTLFQPDVGGQRCPDSVRIYCAVSVGQNQVQIQNPDTRKPYRLKISDLD